jgi:ABC-type uncharacterized transport system involved in gliding motility auxiliary subunit
MNRKHLEALLYSAGGVAAMLLILIAVNFIVSPVPARVDLTEGHVYTLSPGTRQVLGKLDGEVTLRFYYSQGSSAVPPGLKTFAKRVEDLLSEYRTASGGRVKIEKLNPEPDSDAEDSATLDGIEGQLTATQEKFYLGLSISYLDKKVAIPVLAPERERLLEYDITRAIARVGQTKKPVVGIMSAVPVLGRPLNPMLKQQPLEPWATIAELKNDFDVRRVEMSAEKIDDDVDVLLVIHPRDIFEPTEYAIDQFILRGGRVIAFLDSYAYFDQQPDMNNPLGGNAASASSLPTLLKHWGLDMVQGKVVADMSYPSGEGARLIPTLLSLQGEALNQEDVVTSQVGTMLLPFSSAFTGTPVPGLKQTVLAQTSTNSMLVDLIIATLSGEPATKGFEPSGKNMPLAIRLAGQFRTAFPNGKPPHPLAPRPDPKKDAGKAEEAKPAAVHLSEGKAENQVVLVADMDMLADSAAVEVQEVFGQKVLVPRNGNLNFLQSLVEQFAGDNALTSLRSRAAFSKPLTVVQDLAMDAQRRYLGKIKELEDSLIQTNEKLQALQRGRTGAQAGVLSAEQQTEIENFKQNAIAMRRDLKEVRKELRAEIETLEFWTKVVNIGLVPVLVSLAGLAFYLARRRRQDRKG